MTARRTGAGALVARLRAEAARTANKSWMVSIEPDRRRQIDNTAKRALAGKAMSPSELRMIGEGLRLGLAGKSFDVAFGIRSGVRGQSKRPYAMAVDSLWRQAALERSVKVADAETALLFGLRSTTAHPTSVRKARELYGHQIRYSVAMTVQTERLTEREAWDAIRHKALLHAAD